MTDDPIELFSTCPPLSKGDGGAFLSRAIEIARWSDRVGCTGILVYSDNAQLDPWLLAQAIVQHTRTLCPLVAVQPAYLHPYSVAKMVATLGHVYGRRVYLNMVAGGFRNDLLALNDTTPHDHRYDRLVEYTRIIQQLLEGGPASLSGKYYQVDKLRLTPALPPELFPGIFVSGSSPAGLAAAHTLGATAIKYPKPVPNCRQDPVTADLACGVRVGVISRERGDQAWAVARAQFPEDRKGELTRQLASKVSDSVWHRQLAELAEAGEQGPYWLVPFEQYQTNCPYLVGDYRRVGEELSGYISLGYRTFILDVPSSPEELGHTRKAFDCAREAAHA